MSSAPRAARPDDDTLRLALRLADEVFESPALTGGGLFQVKIKLTQFAGSVTFTEPQRRDLRDLLSVLRKFDMPTHDARITRLFEIVERVGMKPDWQQGLADAKAAYASRNEIRNIRVQEPEEPPTDHPTWITPRKAFELWVYGEIVHDDYAKELKWSHLPVPAQGWTRQMAYDYMGGLLKQVDFMRRLITHGLVRNVLEAGSP